MRRRISGGAIPTSRVVTVLFTDLVGSTALATRLEPDAADRLRQEHFVLLREAVAAHGGEEVKNLGDGLMVAFPLASAALACAEAMQQAIARANDRAAEPVAVRIGIAHGEVTDEDGDYFGDVVIEAARLCGACEGGRILATQVVQLAAGRRARQELVPLGALDLKGLPDPVPTVEVRWARPEPEGGGSPIALPRRCTAAPSTAFVGRVAERERLDLVRKGCEVDAEVRVVLLSGEAGIGKTTLALEFARAAHDAGCIVLYGRAEEELTVPYGPWAEALAHLVSQAPPALVEALRPHAGSLGRLAPSLTARLGSAPEGATDAETARFVLYRAVAEALAATAELAPVVLLLDDLHWADAPTLQLLRSLVSSPTPMRALVVGTFRDGEVTTGSPMADLLGALHREPNAERLALRGLDDVELLALLEAAAGQEMDADGIALRDALAAETDGNPFFVGELLRHLTESGAIYQEGGRWVAGSDLRDSGLPVSVLEVVGRRVARLGDEGTRVLSTASVIGRDFDLRLLAAVTELDEDRLLDALDAAVAASLIDYVDGDRYSFVHALIEHTLYESLAPARRARLHRRVAEALEEAGAADPSPQAAALAHHWARATVPGDVDKALHYAMAAGDAALQHLAPDEGVRWYSNALSLLDQQAVASDAQRCRILVGLGEALRQVGNPAYRETLLEAAELARRTGDDVLLIAAALANSRGFVSDAGRTDSERLAVLRAAHRAVEGSGSAAEARLLALLAREVIYEGDLAGRTEIADRALAVARELDDPATLAAVIADVAQAIQVPVTLRRRLDLSREAWDLVARGGDPHLRFWTATYRANYLLEAGQVDAGDELIEVARSIASEVGQPLLRWVVAFGDSCRAMLAGDLEAAEQHCTAAAEIATATGQPDALTFLGAQLSTIRIMQGRAGEVVDLVQAVRDQNPGVPSFDSALALALVELDRLDEARAVLARLEAAGFAFPEDLAYLGGTGQAAAVVGELGWKEAAEVLYERLLPHREQLFYIGLTSGPEMSLWIGLLATVLGRFDEAASHLARSADTHERIGAAWALVLTRIYTGRLLLARDQPGDRELAVAGLREARAEADRRGYAGLVRRAEKALSSAGVDAP